MAAYVMTLRKDTEDRAAAHFLVGCSKLLPVLVEHEARLPRWDREDPGATANFVVCPHALPPKMRFPCSSARHSLQTDLPFHKCYIVAMFVHCVLAGALPNGPFSSLNCGSRLAS